MKYRTVPFTLVAIWFTISLFVSGYLLVTRGKNEAFFSSTLEQILDGPSDIDGGFLATFYIPMLLAGIVFLYAVCLTSVFLIYLPKHETWSRQEKSQYRILLNSLYYLGFLVTLIGLCVGLVEYAQNASSKGSDENWAILLNNAAALGTTIAALFMRTLINLRMARRYSRTKEPDVGPNASGWVNDKDTTVNTTLGSLEISPKPGGLDLQWVIASEAREVVQKPMVGSDEFSKKQSSTSHKPLVPLWSRGWKNRKIVQTRNLKSGRSRLHQKFTLSSIAGTFRRSPNGTKGA